MIKLRFFNSQSKPEKEHLINALTFELGKLKSDVIRSRMLGRLTFVDANLAKDVAEGLGISGMFIAIPLTAIVKIIFDRIEPMKPYGLLIGIEIPVNTKFINSFTERRKIKIKDEGKEIK